MDINLPGMSGLDVVAQLRAWPETHDIPVIGLSAAALLNDTTRAKDLIRTLEELLVRRN